MVTKSNTTSRGAFVKLRIRNTIKVTKSHHLYSGLSLLAEVGGHVGLFLGISVVHFNDIIQKVIEKITSL